MRLPGWARGEISPGAQSVVNCKPAFPRALGPSRVAVGAKLPERNAHQAVRVHGCGHPCDRVGLSPVETNYRGSRVWSSASASWLEQDSIAQRNRLRSCGSTRRPQPGFPDNLSPQGKVRRDHNRMPAAMYSNSLMGIAFRKFGSDCNTRRPKRTRESRFAIDDRLSTRRYFTRPSPVAS